MWFETPKQPLYTGKSYFLMLSYTKGGSSLWPQGGSLQTREEDKTNTTKATAHATAHRTDWAGRAEDGDADRWKQAGGVCAGRKDLVRGGWWRGCPSGKNWHNLQHAGRWLGQHEGARGPTAMPQAGALLLPHRLSRALRKRELTLGCDCATRLHCCNPAPRARSTWGETSHVFGPGGQGLMVRSPG